MSEHHCHSRMHGAKVVKRSPGDWWLLMRGVYVVPVLACPWCGQWLGPKE